MELAVEVRLKRDPVLKNLGPRNRRDTVTVGGAVFEVPVPQTCRMVVRSAAGIVGAVRAGAGVIPAVGAF